MLAENTCITELNLGWNSLREKGIEALAQSMESNISLRILNISWNGIGVKGGTAWGHTMANNTSIKILDMGYMNVADMSWLFSYF